MKKNEYLRLLRIYLQDLPPEEIEDILLDYQEHFHIGLSKGKSEEEISRELGNPQDIAKNYNISNESQQFKSHKTSTPTNDSGRRLLLILVLGFFNLVVVFGPFIGIIGLLIGIYGAGMGFTFGGMGILFGMSFSLVIPISNPHILTSISFGIGLTALGALTFIGAFYLTKLLYSLTIRYINWNINMING